MKSHKGKIDIICGSMFSGKTEELIRRLKRLDFANKKYKLFKPVVDNRYDNNKVVSHNMNAVQATIISKSEDIYKHIKSEKIIAIDEAQFLDEKLYEVCKKLIEDGIDIILITKGADNDIVYLTQKEKDILKAHGTFAELWVHSLSLIHI